MGFDHGAVAARRFILVLCRAGWPRKADLDRDNPD
jgi:hypothetical protein